MVSKEVDKIFVVSPNRFIDFTTVVDGKLTGTFEIVNVNEERIAFRIQTNSRCDYCVQPASGFIDPVDRVLVSVTVRQDGNIDSRHSFLIHALISREQNINRDEFWRRHKKLATHTWNLTVKAPEFDELGLRERLLTQVKALRETNVALRKKISITEERIQYLTSIIEQTGSEVTHHLPFAHFAFAMISFMLTIVLMDIVIGKIWKEPIPDFLTNNLTNTP